MMVPMYHDPKVAVALLIARGGALLLQQRAMEPARGLWSFIGGYVDRGEQVERAAEREAVEELGAAVRLTHLLGVYSEPENPVVLIVYAANLHDPDMPLTPQAEEITALGWFMPDALPPLAFAHDAQIVADWQAWVREGREVPPR